MAKTKTALSMASLPLTPLADGKGPDAGHHPGLRRGVATDLICRYLPDTTLTYVNDAYCQRFGKRELLLGRPFLDLIPEGRREQARRHVDSLIAYPRIETWEHEVVLANRRKGWQEWLDFVIVGTDGAVTELQGIGRDITVRKRHEASLATQYAVSRLLADDADINRVLPKVLVTIAIWLECGFAALWIADEGELRCMGVGKKPFRSASALERESLHSTLALSEVVPGQVKSGRHNVWRANLATASGVRRARLALDAGFTSGLWQSLYSGGRLVGVLELFGDHSYKPDPPSLSMLQAIGLHLCQYVERSLARNALRRGEVRFRALIQHATDGVLIVDAEGLISDVSASAASILGYSPADLTGISGFSLVHAHDLDAARAFLASTLDRSHAGGPIEVRVRRGDSSWRLVEVRAFDLRSEEGVGGVVINFRDVTEQRSSERALHLLSARLLQTQDEERRRIARDLHDGAAQDLLALGVNLELIRRRQRTPDTVTEELFEQSQELLSKATREIRTLSYVLHPPLLDETGLAAALHWFVDGFVNRSGIAVQFIEEQEIGRLPNDVEIALFRVAQESLVNVRRHSGSQTAVIQLSRTQAEVTLQISDRGMAEKRSQTPSEPVVDHEPDSLGVGISGMRERLRQLGGTLEVVISRQGTIVTARVPVHGGDS